MIMASTQDECVVLSYAKWLPIYDREVPFQILSDFSGDYKRTNLEFGPAPVAETIHDIRNLESTFKLDIHGFQVCLQETSVQDWTDRRSIETQYYDEMEQMLRSELDDVDEVFFYDWRVC